MNSIHVRARLILICYLALAVIATLPLYGQRKAKMDTMAALRAYNEGHRHLKAGKYDSAITNFQQAAEGYKAYALSLPDKKKWLPVKKNVWERYCRIQTNVGLTFGKKREYDTAIKLLLVVHTECRQMLGDSVLLLAQIAVGIATTYADLTQYDSALVYLDQALIIRKQALGLNHIQVASVLNNIGRIYSFKSDYLTALKYFEQSLAIKRQSVGEFDIDVALAYTNIGITYNDLGQYERALKFHQQALAIRQRNLGEIHTDVARCYNNIGNVYNQMGQHDQALENHLEALRIRRLSQDESKREIAQSYHNIGNSLLFQKKYDKSLDFYRQSLSIKREVYGDDHIETARVYGNIATIHALAQRNDSALFYIDQSIAITQKTIGMINEEIAGNLALLGFVYSNQKQWQLAMQNKQQALSILKDAFGHKHPKVAAMISNIGNVYALQQLSTPAIDSYTQSLECFLPNYANTGFKSLHSTSYKVLPAALNELSLELWKRNAPGDDTLALATVRFADRFIDSLRKAYTYENDKLQLGEDANRLYQVAIDVAKWNKLDEEAFYYSEKNKAAVLARSLNEASALKMGGIPDSLLEKDKELRTLVAFYTKASIDEEQQCPTCDSTKLQQFKSALFKHQQEQSLLKTRLENDFPQYYALKYKDTVMGVKQIQQGFLTENPNSAILEYLLGDTVLYAFCITKDTYSFHRQKLDSTNFKSANHLQLQAIKLGRALADAQLFLDSTARVSQPASILYDYLIKPFEQQIQGKDLIIIPDGELNKIPFELLIKPNPNLKSASKWQELPYLIQQHNISYHYSANLFIEGWQKAKSQPVQSNGILAFAPVFQSSTLANREQLLANAHTAIRQNQQPQFNAFLSDLSTYSPLPGTEQEVKAIYELFNQKKQPAKYYLNDQANESTVKSINLKPYKYLHFATHGLTDEDRPTNSCLILAQNPTPNSDNLLTSSEMYGLELDAELVVLSACQTGKGTLKAGEGIIGLTRGLLYAGARNLMVSQWNVNDASTAELMTKFYSKILAGQSNRQALREAKIELLNSKFACPHYWSAFVLVGR